MPYDVKVDDERGIIFLLANGQFTSEDLLTSLHEIVERDDYIYGGSFLVDLRKVEQYDPNLTDMHRRLKKDLGVLDFLGGVKIGMIASDAYIHGMIKMYEMLMKNSSCDVKTFRDISAARKWLGLPEE